MIRAALQGWPALRQQDMQKIPLQFQELRLPALLPSSGAAISNPPKDQHCAADSAAPQHSHGHLITPEVPKAEAEVPNMTWWESLLEWLRRCEPRLRGCRLSPQLLAPRLSLPPHSRAAGRQCCWAGAGPRREPGGTWHRWPATTTRRGGRPPLPQVYQHSSQPSPPAIHPAASSSKRRWSWR